MPAAALSSQIAADVLIMATDVPVLLVFVFAEEIGWRGYLGPLVGVAAVALWVAMQRTTSVSRPGGLSAGSPGRRDDHGGGVRDVSAP